MQVIYSQHLQLRENNTFNGKQESENTFSELCSLMIYSTACRWSTSIKMNGPLRQDSQRTCSDWILRGFSLYCGEEFELVVTLSSARPAFPLASSHDTVSDRSVKGISQNHNCYVWRGQHLLERLNKVRAMNSSYSLRSSSIDGQRRTILTVSSDNYVFQKTWSFRGLLAGW